MQNYVLFGVSFLAALMDFISFQVKNWLIVVGTISGLVFCTYQEGMGGFITSLAGAVLPLLCLWVFFLAHLLGAGDIKLLCAIGSFLGPEKILYCMGAAILIGGLFSAARLLLYDREERKNTIRFAIPIFLSVVLYQGGFY